MPAGFGEFGENAKFSFDQPSQEYLGESSSGNGGLQLKSKSAGSLANDNLSKDFGSPSGLAFSNRYDFGPSFKAAVQAAKDKETSPQDQDGLYMKANVRNSKPTLTVPEPTNDGKSQMTALGATSPKVATSRSIYEELVNKYCFVRTLEVLTASSITSGAHHPSLGRQNSSITHMSRRDGTETLKQNGRVGY
ncbi:hypothetical protein FOPG_20066 [Fusarium oxysporum f. sp. conglutinans race 2 54008]|nr:hypothetical protein FOPG_20066 [Fusarium oxysporum f. sp. conglutinans race 2 54008]